MRQKAQGTVLPFNAPIQASVVDSDADTARDERKKSAILVGKGVQACRLQIDNADKLSADEHGDCQLSANCIKRVQVAGIRAHIRHKDGPLGGGSSTCNSLTKIKHETLHNFVAMTDGVADPETAGARVIE